MTPAFNFHGLAPKQHTKCAHNSIILKMVKIVCASLSWHALSKIPSPCSLLVASSFDVVVTNGIAKLDHFNIRFQL
jgi:hypothetical protein